MRERAYCEICKLPLARRTIRFPSGAEMIASNNEAHDATLERILERTLGLQAAGVEISITHRPKADYE